MRFSDGTELDSDTGRAQLECQRSDDASSQLLSGFAATDGRVGANDSGGNTNATLVRTCFCCPFGARRAAVNCLLPVEPGGSGRQQTDAENVALS